MSVLALPHKFLIGSTLWILSIQYFIIEYIVQRAWSPVPYSLRFNTISDLGATVCGNLPVIGTFACSPLHALINSSFVLNGVLAIAGLYLLRSIFPKHQAVSLALLLIALGSLGTIGVGVFPENENIVPHMISAGIVFILGNLGLLLLGKKLYQLQWHKKYARLTMFLGALGLSALVILPLTLSPLGGIGVMERIVAYPVTIWVIVSGILIVRSELRLDYS